MLTPEQIALRKQGIGSSDIARILYFDKWEVWAEKTGKAVNKPYTPAMRRGDALEPVIAELYRERIQDKDPIDITKGETIIDGFMVATPDYIVYIIDEEYGRSIEYILECKASGAYWSGWGDEWTDNIPKYIIAQCQWQMAVTGLDLCHVGAFVGNDFRIYEVKRDDSLITKLYNIGYDFWHKYVLTDTPPPVDGSDAATRYLDKLFPKSNGVMLNATHKTETMIECLISRNASISRDRSVKSRLENELKQIIGDADGIEGLCTWKADKNGMRRFRLLEDK